ncbi:MAG: 5'/3'-nucleotidase SurE [Proteobacteria bacterium]|nr:5'/3'-nucleotidase SurE [Pseudomonadota bacterium]
MSSRLILLTNDDGVNTEGIRILKKALDPIGIVVIVAPSSEQSGTGHSLTMHAPVRVKELEKNIYSVTGYPSDCVYAAVHGLLPRKPDIIISGINKGANMGLDVYYSGTVAGARQGIIDGITQGFSLSLVVDKKDKEYFWDDTAAFARQMTTKILEKGYKGKGFLNINYPNLPKEKINGVRITKIGDKHYAKEVRWGKDPRGDAYCWLWGDYCSFEQIEGSDCVAVNDGYISVSPMLLDMTDYSMIEELKTWEI